MKRNSSSPAATWKTSSGAKDPTTEICDKCGSPLIMKWGKFGSFYSCSAFTKAKPVTIAAAPWKKDPKAVLKKVLSGFHFPMIVKAMNGDETTSQVEVDDAKAFAKAVADAQGKGKKVVAEAVSCDFTKENIAAKPDLTAPGADEAPEEEFCDNCGRLMVLKKRPLGPVHVVPRLLDDPPCKTIRKLTQKVQSKPPVVLEEPCRSAASRCSSATAATASSSPAPATRSASTSSRTCSMSNAPRMAATSPCARPSAATPSTAASTIRKCDFSSNLLLVDEQCPLDHAAYLVEYSNKGRHLLRLPQQPRVPAQTPPEERPAG